MYNEVRFISYIYWHKIYKSEFAAVEDSIWHIFSLTDEQFEWQIKKIANKKWILYAEV